MKNNNATLDSLQSSLGQTFKKLQISPLNFSLNHRLDSDSIPLFCTVSLSMMSTQSSLHSTFINDIWHPNYESDVHSLHNGPCTKQGTVNMHSWDDSWDAATCLTNVQ